jgi:hypothetical protein
MCSTKNNLIWVNQQRKMIKENYGIDSKIIQNGHLKIIFYRGDTQWMWVTSNTPRNVDSRRKSISILRNGLKKNFNEEIDKSVFTIQFIKEIK